MQEACARIRRYAENVLAAGTGNAVPCNGSRGENRAGLRGKRVMQEARGVDRARQEDCKIHVL